MVERSTFKIVSSEEAGEKRNIVPSMYVFAIKHKESGKDVLRARFVVSGHRDREKNSLVHNSTNLKQSSIRTIIALATILGFDVWSVDVNHAYLQSDSKLRRIIFVNPEMIELGPNELLQTIRPLYGLSDSGDYRYKTLTKCHTSKLRMKKATGDFALFFRRIADKLVALLGTYVNDILQAGTQTTKRNMIKALEKEFDIKQPERNHFEYTGTQ